VEQTCLYSILQAPHGTFHTKRMVGDKQHYILSRVSKVYYESSFGAHVTQQGSVGGDKKTLYFITKAPLSGMAHNKGVWVRDKHPIFLLMRALPLDICHTTLVHTESSIMLH
jgi:hypothetical protein